MKNTMWNKTISHLESESLAFINGDYLEPEPNSEKHIRLSPIDGNELPAFYSASSNHVDMAVKAARESFDKESWTGKTPTERKHILNNFADLIEQHAYELAVRDTLSMGKALRDSLYKDLPNAVNCFRWFAEAIDKYYGEALPSQPGVLATVSREPLGVVTGVSPWNYPMENVAWKIAPALAAGNSMILKAAEQSTLSACYLGKLAIEAGIPSGVLNILPGKGSTTGQQLIKHNHIDGVFFTGSSATGRTIASLACQSRLKKVALECGGKSAYIVLASSNKLKQAAQTLAQKIFSNQGQTCSAPSRLIIEESIKEEFISYLLPLVEQYQPDDPRLDSTIVGAMVSQEQLQKVLHYVETGTKQGAKLIAGGSAIEPVPGGFYMTPTIFTDVDNTFTIAQEEIFGPVLSIITAKDCDDALQLANQSRYGLAAAVWTDDLDTAHRLSQKLRSGSVYINCHDEADMTAPFGGFGDSGNGSKEKSLHAIDAYSELKMTWLRLGDKQH